jgi:hypothetical protein
MTQRNQLSLGVGVAQNRNLFPVHFLEDRLPEWPEYASLDTSALLRELGAIWERERSLLPDFNEEQTEDRWVRPILKALGFHYTARPPLAVAGRRREPDYALFLDEEIRARAESVGGSARYAEAVALLEAKRFDRPLDQRRPAGGLSEDPVAQIIYYVSTTQVPFGILTNGRIWRLYAQRGDLVEGAYYEVDLIALLEAGAAAGLRDFAAFFSADSFRPDESGRSFLDRALSESRANAIEIGDALQRQVFAAVPNIAQGLLGAEERTEHALADAFEHSLVFLYRLLFCLHAEARRLLPVDSPHYLEYSVRKQRLALAEAIDRGRVFSHTSSRLYNELEALFKLVAVGDEGLGVNEYNGDLFTASKHPWLEGRAVSDDLLAGALDGLYRLGQQMIDYRDLSVRQLGTIYERLLEYRLVAGEDGGLELGHASGRRDTGSYFTPEPIVDLIVERTLEPLLERRSEEIQARGLRGKRALDAFLELRVVDPAMGSGHFLVSAAAYIAKFIATDPSYDGALDWQQIERQVAERCIYGVDLNPMAVELAKLSLWLSTVRSDVPLTFLSNLRVGNSLVGADVDDLVASDVSLFAERLARDAESLLARAAEIAGVESSSGAKVHEKERIAAAAEALRQPLHEYADESIARYFTAPTPMFHWEIEFPEVFLAKDGSLRSGRGFDAVIGNPPYIRIQSLDGELADWCRDRYEAAFGSFDAYLVFIERAAALLGRGGRLGFIVPNKFLKLEAGKRLRARLAESGQMDEIIDFGDAQLFQGATNYTCVLVLDALGERREFSYRKVRDGRPGIPSPRQIQAAPVESFVARDLGKGPWVLVAGEERRLLSVVRRDAVPLDEAVSQIFQGLITSADPVYILEDRGVREGCRRVYSRASDKELLLEPDLLHALASGPDVERYAFKPLASLLLFPYRRRDGEMSLLSEAELDALPRTAAYLRVHETTLRERGNGEMDGPDWHAFSRTQSLGLHDLAKLGVAATVPRLEVAVDPDGGVYFHNVRVNGILPRPEGPGLFPLMSMLNSKLLDWVFKLGAGEHANGHFAANKQFIAPLPIRLPGADAERLLRGLGERLHRETAALLRERREFRDWLSGLLGVPLEELRGHTRLWKPDLLVPGELEEVIARNRRVLSLDPTSRGLRERLRAEHQASVEKVSEIVGKARRAEDDVDEIVFDLYEVSASHRALVEESSVPVSA